MRGLALLFAVLGMSFAFGNQNADCTQWSREVAGAVANVIVNDTLILTAACNDFLFNASSIVLYCEPGAVVTIVDVRMTALSFAIAGSISDPSTASNITVTIVDSSITATVGVAAALVLGIVSPTKPSTPTSVAADHIKFTAIRSMLNSTVTTSVISAALSMVLDLRFSTSVTVAVSDSTVSASSSTLIVAGGVTSAAASLTMSVSGAVKVSRCAFIAMRCELSAVAKGGATSSPAAAAVGIAMSRTGSQVVVTDVSLLLWRSTVTVSTTAVSNPASAVAGIAIATIGSSLVGTNLSLWIIESKAACGVAHTARTNAALTAAGVAVSGAYAMAITSCIMAVSGGRLQNNGSGTYNLASSIAGIAMADGTGTFTATNLTLSVSKSNVANVVRLTGVGTSAGDNVGLTTAGAAFGVIGAVTVAAFTALVETSTIVNDFFSDSFAVFGGVTVAGLAGGSVDLTLTGSLLYARSSSISNTYVDYGGTYHGVESSRAFAGATVVGMASGRGGSEILKTTNVTMLLQDSTALCSLIKGGYAGTSIAGLAAGHASAWATSTNFAVINSVANTSTANGGSGAAVSGIAVGNYNAAISMVSSTVFIVNSQLRAFSSSAEGPQGGGACAAATVGGIAVGATAALAVTSTNVIVYMANTTALSNASSTVTHAVGSSVGGVASGSTSRATNMRITASRTTLRACAVLSNLATVSCANTSSSTAFDSCCFLEVNSSALTLNITLPPLSPPTLPVLAAPISPTATGTVVGRLRTKTATMIQRHRVSVTAQRPREPHARTRTSTRHQTAQAVRHSRTKTRVAVITRVPPYATPVPAPTTSAAPPIPTNVTVVPMAPPPHTSPTSATGIDHTVASVVVTVGLGSSAAATAFVPQGSKAVGVSRLVTIAECAADAGPFPTPDSGSLFPAAIPLDGTSAGSSASMALTTLFVGCVVLALNAACAMLFDDAHEFKTTRASLCEAAHAMWLGYFGPSLVAVALTLALYPSSPGATVSVLDRVVGVGTGAATLVLVAVTFAACRDGDGGGGKSSSSELRRRFARQWSSFYEGSRAAQLWHVRLYVFEDLAAAYAVNALGGLYPSTWTGCVGACIAMLLVALAHVVYLLLVRPYESRLEGLLAVVNGLITLAVAVLSLAVLATGAHDAAVALGVATLAASAFYFVSAITLCVAAVYELVRSRMATSAASSTTAAVVEEPLLHVPPLSGVPQASDDAGTLLVDAIEMAPTATNPLPQQPPRETAEVL